MEHIERNREEELRKQNEDDFHKLLTLAILEGKSITDLLQDLDEKRKQNG